MPNRPLVPVRFLESVAAGTRRVYFSARYMDGLLIDSVRITFELNTQRLLAVRAWVCFDTSTRLLGSGMYAPSAGVSLFSADGSPATDYVAGDGQEGSIIIPIGRTFPPGCYLAADAENSGANPHALDMVYYCHEVLR